MKQEQCSKTRAGTKHLTYADRVAMEMYIRHRWPGGGKVVYAELAAYMGRGWRSVKGEYLRGLVTNLTTDLVRYTTCPARKGEDAARARDEGKGPRMRLANTHAAFIEEQIVNLRMSPYVAVARMKGSGLFAWVPCVRTVYNALGRGDLEAVRASLPYARTKRKKGTCAGRRMAYRTARGKSIASRPPEAEGRRQYGHWEGDTVAAPGGGSPACLPVLAGRMTRLVRIVRMPGRTRRSVARAPGRLERGTDTSGGMLSLTTDNGSEFRDTDALERSCTAPGAVRCAHRPTPAAPPGAGPTGTPTALSGGSSPRARTSAGTPPPGSRRSRTPSTGCRAKSSAASRPTRQRRAYAMNQPLKNLQIYLASQH
jgi:IS30 family transposase